MKLELINLNKHYDILCGWWKQRNHVIIPLDFLTPFGYICFNNENTPIAAMFLFPILGSKSGLLRFPISNPNSSKEERNKALDSILNELLVLAKDLNIKYLLCTTNHKNLIKRLETFNFKKDASNCEHLVGVL